MSKENTTQKMAAWCAGFSMFEKLICAGCGEEIPEGYKCLGLADNGYGLNMKYYHMNCDPLADITRNFPETFE